MRKLRYFSFFVFLFSLIGPLSISAQCTIQTAEILADTEGSLWDNEATLADEECAVVVELAGCKESQKFRIYPNSATDLVYLEGVETVKIWDAIGRYLGTFTKQIDCSNWAQGIYFAQSEYGFTVKFVKL